MHLDQPRNGARRALAAATIASAMVFAALSTSGLRADAATDLAPTAPPPSSVEDVLGMTYNVFAQNALGLTASETVALSLEAGAQQPFSIDLTLDGQARTIDFVPHSIRAAGYELLVQLDDGTIVSADPGLERTLRGAVRGVPGARVAGSLLEDGLHAMIELDGSTRVFIEPLSSILPDAVGWHVVYRDHDVMPHGGSCGMSDAAETVAFNPVEGPLGPQPEGGICVAQLACDADFEYYQDYGSSVANTQNRITAVINTVNLQYESQVGITHQLSTILVRSSSNDPYTSTDAATRLCEFITEWNANQGGIVRDVAHLFTGVELNSSTIGIAADIGGTGICNTLGDCTGGEFGSFGSYCLAQSDFTTNSACVTDLTAHELGHLWGAFHCNCPNNTMNSGITCTNSFSSATINSITNYRDTRACLSSCPVPGPPANDDCGNATPFNGDNDGVIFYDTTSATTDGPFNPPNTCSDSGQNHTHNDIWYTYTASCSGTLTVSTCDDVHGAGAANYDTDLVVYGPYASVAAIDCGNVSANLAGCNDDDSGNPCGTAAPWASTVQVSASQGDVYLIRVGGWTSTSAGTGWLSVDCAGVATGACCVNTTCSIETQTGCAGAGGIWQGAGTDCSGDPCQPGGDVTNLATADFSTSQGTISSGSYLDTHVQDDVREALTEEQTNGNPARRRSRLTHTWTFNVAAGTSYTFFVEAYHTPNGEGDSFTFAYSLDNGAYTDMVTVTKTADDDALQAYAFPEDVSGLVYVQVTDDDQSQGNSSIDTVFVDEMFIFTSTTPDTTPPAAPAGLAATPGDGSVSLAWNDNGEPDVAGYNVYRSLGSGGPYSQLNGALVGSSAYVDTSVTNGTTYYYVVTAEDTSGNESADSGEANATPQGGLGSLHVDSIVVTTVNIGQGNKRGRAVVTIVDNTGTPVSGATVFGTFSIDLNESLSAVTDGSGVATLTTLSFKKGGVSIQFCVDDVTHGTLPYDDAANVETCDVN
jgi:hypothetical protein